MKIFTPLLISIFTLSTLWALSSLNIDIVDVAKSSVVPGDEDYWVLEAHPKHEIIYSQIQDPNQGQHQDQHKDQHQHQNLKNLRTTLEFSKKLEEFYQKSFAWELDGPSYTILASSKNQIANASSTVLPFNINTLYPAGALDLDSFAIRSWLKTLLIHEMAHLYQINPKQGLAKWTKSIFGNHFFFLYPIIPVPVFINPNVALPTWMVEGNAVFNEGLMGNGGRLFSGEERALFFSLLRARLLNDRRIINNHLFFPFQREKYTVGGYFNLYLAQNYGIDKTNQFFYSHSTHYFNPLRLNATFTQHFDWTYSTLIKRFIQHYQQEADQQKQSSAPLLTSSLIAGPLNHDQKSIYFLTNPTGKASYQLSLFDKKTSRFTQTPIDLPAGKIFRLSFQDDEKGGESGEKDNGKFYSAASDTYKRKEIVYGLWGENKTLLPSSHSRIVVDRFQGKTLYIDARTSFDEGQLYEDGKFIATVNSSALYDDQGNIYYFKQEGKVRTLYQYQGQGQSQGQNQNPKKFFSLQGYYGKIVEINSQGTIYFIGSTPFGSTLYSYSPTYSSNKVKLNRLSESDVIVDARTIDDQKILICEISAQGYQYKVVPIQKMAEAQNTPTTYEYFFEKNPLLPQLAGSPSSSEKTEPLPSSYRYYALTNLHFQAWDATSYFGHNGETTLRAHWIDPLLTNKLSLRTEFSHQEKEKIIEVQYENSRHLLQWNLQVEGVAEKRQPRSNGNKTGPDPTTLTLKAGVKYPLLEWHHWKADLQAELIHKNHLRAPWEIYTAAEIGSSQVYPLSFSPYRYLNFLGENLAKKSGHKAALSWQFLYDLGQENFLEQETVLHHDRTGDLKLGVPINRDSHLLPVITHRIYSSSRLQGGRVGIGYKKVFNVTYYSSTFPLGIRRLAPHLFANIFSYSTRSSLSILNYKEAGVGLQGDYLLAHLLPFKMAVEVVKRFPKGETSIVLNISGVGSP